MKTWSPDTCVEAGEGLPCQIEEIYDEIFDTEADNYTWITDPIEGVILAKGRYVVLGISGGKVLRKCIHHANVPDEKLYELLRYKENAAKNCFYRILTGEEETIQGLNLHQDTTPAKDADRKNELFTVDSGETVTKNTENISNRELKPGIEYEWHFTGKDTNRKLKVGVKGAVISEKHKDDIRAYMIENFGDVVDF